MKLHDGFFLWVNGWKRCVCALRITRLLLLCIVNARFSFKAWSLKYVTVNAISDDLDLAGSTPGPSCSKVG